MKRLRWLGFVVGLALIAAWVVPAIAEQVAAPPVVKTGQSSQVSAAPETAAPASSTSAPSSLLAATGLATITLLEESEISPVGQVAARITGPTRPVVIEEFTGEWCPYCYSVGIALERLYDEYSPTDLVVIAYHFGDPFAISVGYTRQSQLGVGGYPTAWFNAFRSIVGGWNVSYGESGILDSYNDCKALFLAEQTRTSSNKPFWLAMHGSFSRVNPQFQVSVMTTEGYPRSVRLEMLVTEDHIAFNCSNGQTELSFVPRAYLGSRTMSLTSPQLNVYDISYSTTVPCSDETELRPVLFLIDNTTQEVLAATTVFTDPLLDARPTWELYQ